MKVQLCHYPGCNVFAQGYYCPKHKAIADKQREQRQQENKKKLFKGTQRTTSKPYHHLYNCARWRRLRKEFLSEHNRCVVCGGKADTVDHIYPHKGNLEMFYNLNNLQAMCHNCHSAKTLNENSYFKKNLLDR